MCQQYGKRRGNEYIATPVYYKNGKLKKISNSEVDCTLTYEEWIDEIIKQVEHADYLAKKRKVDAKYVAQIEAIIEARRIEYQQLQMPISALKIPRSSRE